MVLCAGIGGCIWLNILPMICESNAIGAAIGILLVVMTLFLTLVFSGDRFS